jgi:hypothetical protein
LESMYCCLHCFTRDLNRKGSLFQTQTVLKTKYVHATDI